MTDGLNPAESGVLRELLHGDANILPRLLEAADGVKRIEGMLGGGVEPFNYDVDRNGHIRTPADSALAQAGTREARLEAALRSLMDCSIAIASCVDRDDAEEALDMFYAARKQARAALTPEAPK